MIAAHLAGRNPPAARGPEKSDGGSNRDSASSVLASERWQRHHVTGSARPWPAGKEAEPSSLRQEAGAGPGRGRERERLDSAPSTSPLPSSSSEEVSPSPATSSSDRPSITLPSAATGGGVESSLRRRRSSLSTFASDRKKIDLPAGPALRLLALVAPPRFASSVCPAVPTCGPPPFFPESLGPSSASRSLAGRAASASRPKPVTDVPTPLSAVASERASASEALDGITSVPPTSVAAEATSPSSMMRMTTAPQKPLRPTTGTAPALATTSPVTTARIEPSAPTALFFGSQRTTAKSAMAATPTRQSVT